MYGTELCVYRVLRQVVVSAACGRHAARRRGMAFRWKTMRAFCVRLLLVCRVGVHTDSMLGQEEHMLAT